MASIPSSSTPSVRPGDRVWLRERPWKVRVQHSLSEGIATLELDALDGSEPSSLSVVVPPDFVEQLPPEPLHFDPHGLDAYASWTRGHRFLSITAVRNTALVAGARFGRVALEAYQLAPTLRLLAKPQPRLLIADDVGLGKTIEAGIALLELMARGRARRVLVVTPPGLLIQWKDELAEKFGLQFTVIANAAGLSEVQSELPAGTNPWDVVPLVLTSVDFLKKETVRSRALRKRWDLIIVDEAHALAEAGTPENPYRTQRTRLGQALRQATRGLLLLTATPHNGYPHSFRSLIELVEPTAAVLRGDPADRARRIASAMVRRMKSQIVRRLPDGSEERVFPERSVKGVPVPLSSAERELLHRVASYCSRTALLAERTEDEDLVMFAMQIVKKRALSSRVALRETIENRLDALKEGTPEEARPERADIRDLQADLPLDESTAERAARRIVRAAIPREERRRKAEATALKAIRKALRALTGTDPKIEALRSEIESILHTDRSDKIIVFTEYLDTLESIRSVLEDSKELKGRTVVLRGGMTGRQRLRIQQRFEEPEVNVLLATDAASEGLNLQWACHRVIHFALPWNPNRLEQRNGRVDRYGQTRSPQIKYLFFPDSPEDDVLHRLVEKIEQIQRDRVSTPDILGVLRGAGEVEHGLVTLDPEAPDVESRKASLVRLFDDRTADFVRNVQPLFASAGEFSGEDGRLLDLIDTANALVPDDLELETLVSETLGSSAVRHTEEQGIFRIEVPLRYRGPSVPGSYPRATFRRSISIKYRPDEVEFFTPIHPLLRAIATNARRKFLQVYPDDRGLPPRRLAARRVSSSEPTSVIFTFFGQIAGNGGLLEESVTAARVTPGLEPVGTEEEATRWLEAQDAPGEVAAGLLSRLFASTFEEMAHRASQIVQQAIRTRADELRQVRKGQAQTLSRELERDTADRLAEIDDEERRFRGLVETETGQVRLFAEEDRKAGGFQARRAAVEQQAATRRVEIAEFESVEEPPSPRPLGALFLVSAGLA